MAGELIATNEQHEALAVSRFIDQFKDKAKLAALLASYAEQIQDIEDAAFEVMLERSLDNAVGIQLQILAKIVGAPITTSVDDELRIIIRTQIAINLSDGTPEDLINILRLVLLLSGETFRITEEPPHQVRLTIDDPLSSIVNPNTTVTLLDSADMGSIRILLSYFVDTAAEDMFTLDDSVAGGLGGLGLGDNVAGGVGGDLASVADPKD